jgi:ABC-type lipoprotein export system ATPase subunit
VHVLKGVSLSVDEGDYVAIMGHSGTGRARCSTSSGAWTSRRRGGT